ncbi:MAG: hypothetical protein AAF889_10625, partial [Cyanobacteria bacterium P01_D01_bin.73]
MTTNPNRSRLFLSPKISAKVLSLLPGLICLGLLGYPLTKSFSRSFDSAYLETIEKRDPSRFPKRTYFNAWLKKRNYKQLSKFIDDRLPFRGLAIQGKQTLSQNILGESRFPRVDVGSNDWLYYRLSYGLESTGDGDLFSEERVEYALENLQYFLEWQKRENRQTRVTVVPNKHTIYPEHLSDQAKRDLAKTQKARELLYQWFQNSESPNLINLWDAYRQEKVQRDYTLFFPEDTHHSSWGSMVLMRSIIQSLNAELWNENEIRDYPDESQWNIDLKQMLGHPESNSQDKLPVFRILRPGVIVQDVSVKGQKFSSLTEAVVSGLATDRNNIVSVTPRSDGPPLIPGKTLVIRDSFLGPPQQELLGQYFQSVDYLHSQSISQDFIHTNLKNYNSVIIAVVERNFISFLEKLPRYPKDQLPKGKNLIFRQGNSDYYLIGDVGKKTKIQIKNGVLHVLSQKPKPYIRITGPSLRRDKAHELKVVMHSPKADIVTLYYSSDYQLYPV